MPHSQGLSNNSYHIDKVKVNDVIYLYHYSENTAVFSIAAATVRNIFLLDSELNGLENVHDSRLLHSLVTNHI